jgi:hypothetical protein
MPMDNLYDDDFYAWTQQQADLLRRLPASSNQLDAQFLAEEIEDLGRSEIRSAQSLCEHVIEHLLKMEYSGLTEPVGHWRHEIVGWRVQLERTLTRSIVAKLDLPECYKTALRLLRQQEPPMPEIIGQAPHTCPYSLDQIVGTGEEDWFPEPQ